MKLRRVSGPALACLLVSVLLLSGAPAGARAPLDLHHGSRGATVKVLESRLAKLSFLDAAAVDGRYFQATVNAVRAFQWRLGLAVTGRVDQRTYDAVRHEPARRAARAAPQVLGHRGEVGSPAGENTLAALRLATPYADRLEFDLVLTADHELVLMHDLTLDRTTNCTGPVASWTLADLSDRCTVGDQPIPTFEEVAAYAASVGKPIAPELKDAGPSADDLAKTVAVLEAHDLVRTTWLQSVYARTLVALSAREPDLRLVLVSTGVPSTRTATAAHADAVAVRLDLLNLPRSAAYHLAKLKVWAWTARSRTDLEMARAMHADAVVTDVPSMARSLYR